MVWIHGGGFVSGSGSLPAMYGERLSGQEHVVVVSLNYRLGVFGFFAHPELSAESRHGVSGNYGLLDQIAALRWVRRNIAAFGGDPRRVTIFGQSAGGQCVISHLVSPLSRGLFARAISESPRYQDRGVGLWSTLTLEEQEQEGEEICDDPSAFADGPGRARGSPQGPRGAPDRGDRARHPAAAAPLRAAADAVVPARGGRPRAARGAVAPDQARQSGRRCRCSSAATRTSATCGSRGVKPAAADDAVALASRQRVSWYTGPDWPGLAAQFPAPDYGGLLPATSRLTTVLEFNAPARYTARCVASQKLRAYLYYFSRVPPGDSEGAHHSAEIPYVFDSLNPAHAAGRAESADLRLAGQMAHYWATFAATGDPNAPGQPRWPRYDPAADVLLQLDAPLRAIAAPYPAACALAEQANRDH